MTNESTGPTLKDRIIFTRYQAADLLNLSVSMIDRYRRSGRLKAMLITSLPDAKRPKPMYHRDELERFARSLGGE